MNKFEINKFAIRDPKIAKPKITQTKCSKYGSRLLGLISGYRVLFFIIKNIIVCMSEIENGNHLNLCLIHELIIIFCHQLNFFVVVPPLARYEQNKHTFYFNFHFILFFLPKRFPFASESMLI